jgi:hypothetical protein
MHQYKHELATTITLENGKPLGKIIIVSRSEQLSCEQLNLLLRMHMLPAFSIGLLVKRHGPTATLFHPLTQQRDL